MLRRTFLLSLVGLSGCGKAFRKHAKPQPIEEAEILPIPRQGWVKGQPNPNRVVVYLDCRETVTQVKRCINGVCHIVNVKTPNKATAALKASLYSLQEKDWKVGADESQHIQVVETQADTYVAKYLENHGIVTKTCSNMTAVWVSKFYYDQSLTCEPKPVVNTGASHLSGGGRTYPKQSSQHKGVVGESWQAYYTHLITSPNHRELWNYAGKLRYHSLESLKRIHDASHFGKVQLELVLIENGILVV